VNSDISGLFTYWRLQNTILYEDIYSQFEIMLPVSPEGYKPKVSSILELADFGAALTVHNEYIRESLRWLDAQMETETMMEAQNGPMGDMLEINSSGKYEVQYVPPNNELYSIVPVICGQFFAPADYYSGIYELAPHRIEKSQYCDLYETSGVMEYKSFNYLLDLAPFTAQENIQVNRLYKDIENYMVEALTSFITRGVTDQSWESFIDGLDGLGVYEYVALYQDAYDRYLQNN
jgi:putative aldouronate transport system substrate-binding protein